MGGYATEQATAMGRELDPDNNQETITPEDYRKRYAKYRTDLGLQALHANTPFIAVWDDHEICNDSHVDGAENHNQGEGDFSESEACSAASILRVDAHSTAGKRQARKFISQV